MSAAAARPAAIDTRPYAGRVVALLTQHGKETLAGALTDGLGCIVERATGVDTDTLGTFTRDVPRTTSALEAARAKARMACALHGTPLGLGSEGSFGLDPALGLLPWNHELVLLHDAQRGIEVVGRASGGACWGHARVRTWADADAFAHRFGFPSHAMVVRPDASDDPRIARDLFDTRALRAAFDAAHAVADGGWVSIEVDGRAHANPTRQGVIRAAMADLAARLACACPACGMPGFGDAGPVPGLPCGGCDRPTPRARARRHACVACDHADERNVDNPWADPEDCPACNP
mgnify:CR=1 FL=1